MFVTDKVNAIDLGKFVSLEFFPPKTDAGFRNLLARLTRMKALNPLFITITWGAGGSTSEKSLELASICQKQLGITTVLHLTCTNTNKEVIDDALQKAKEAGITNILALRGDAPRTEEYWTPNCDFTCAADLVKYIRLKHGNYFCVGVAGYPEGHVDGSDSLNRDVNKDIPFLVEKVKAGADFIITQLFYDVEKFVQYHDILKSNPDLKETVLIPGLMPINTFNSFKKATKLSHADIPQKYLDAVSKVKSDDDAVKNIGINILQEIIDEIVKRTTVKGFHMYTLNLEKAVASIVETSQVFSADVEMEDVFDEEDEEVTTKPANFKRRQSSVTAEVDPKPNIKSLISISKGKGLLGKDANWDDFPNGRFGDSNSPAYGEIDGYGPNLKVTSSERAIELWRTPELTLDLARVFIDYLSNKIPQLPWVDTPLDIETSLIQEQLFELNLRGWFSTASQPAVNACPSKDKIFGWGPPNGVVYQKAFVELFVPKNDWDNKIKPALSSQIANKTITYYLGDNKGIADTNLTNSESKSAVTWGVFPSKEILQPTLIDLDSFKAWNEEAFVLWLEWARCYKKATNTYEFLNFIYDNYYLVSIIHHDFVDENGLWDLLLDIE